MNVPSKCAQVHLPSTTTFLVLMVTLTPSGTSSSSSEWLFPMSAKVRPCLELLRCRRAGSFDGVRCGGSGQYFEGSGECTIAYAVNVHVLHLEGCCGLAVVD
jgi:hypothetical protein